jgi:DNA-binding MarR family transcriptional regulator
VGEPKRKTRADDAAPARTGKLQVSTGLGAAASAPALDRLVHDRVRLGMLSALAVSEKLGFTELRSVLDTTDGNLSAHARKLEEAGYITVEKTFRDRTPHTEFTLTIAGRSALEVYLNHMESLVRAVRAMSE